MISRNKNGLSEQLQPVKLSGYQVEIVNSFKYLGTFIDSNLSFTGNVDYVFKKAMQRVHLLRRLKHFGVSKNILEMVYKNFVESIMSFNMTMWYGVLTVKSKQKLSRVVNIASAIVGKTQRQLNEIYLLKVKEKARVIIEDLSHPLHSSFQLLPSRRRFRQPRASKNVYQMSFVPTAIRFLNAEKP